MPIGRCDDCGHPFTVYEWPEAPRCTLAEAVCPVHGTALARTTYPRDRYRIVRLEKAPRRVDRRAMAFRRSPLAEAGADRYRWEPLFHVLGIEVPSLDAYDRKALGDLREGAIGASQPPNVKTRLRELERAGMIRWQTGWHLTARGRAELGDCADAAPGVAS